MKKKDKTKACVLELTKLLDHSGLLHKYGYRTFGSCLQACAVVTLAEAEKKEAVEKE